MNFRTEMVPMHYVQLGGQEFEAGDLLEVLEELTDGISNIEIINKTMEASLKAEGIILHGGSRRALVRAALAEGGEEKAQEVIDAIRDHLINYEPPTQESKPEPEPLKVVDLRNEEDSNWMREGR
jgi:hypothetical protein